MVVDVADTQYQVVRSAAARLGWPVLEVSAPTAAANKADIKWHDAVIKPNDIPAARETGVRWNHFPGIESLCTKCGMQQTLGRLADKYPKEFRFMPRSWTLPVQKVKLQHFMDTKGKKNGTTLIVKPNTSSRGRGIYLTSSMPEASADSALVQEYLEKPLTINGFKFDLRMYVFVSDLRCKDGSFPRVFLHHEGLTRFCTTRYEPPNEANMADNTLHLSNYSVNKWSTQFVKEEGVKETLAATAAESEANGGLLPTAGEYRFGGGADGSAYGGGLTESDLLSRVRASQVGSKWTLTAFANWAHEQGHDVAALWRRCEDLVAKTVLCAAVTTMRDQYV